MKNTLRIVTLIATMQATSVFAASGVESGGISLGGWIFIGFMAVIVTFQAIPAAMMFGSMMVALFGKTRNLERSPENGKANNA